jgi:hypothetical protein
MRIYRQVSLSTNVSSVVEEKKQINNQPAHYRIKKTNERVSKKVLLYRRTVAYLFKIYQWEEFKRKFLTFQQIICLKVNFSSATTS